MNFEKSMTTQNLSRKWGLMADFGGRCSTLRLRYYNSLFTNALFCTINPQQTTGPASIIDSNKKTSSNNAISHTFRCFVYCSSWLGRKYWKSPWTSCQLCQIFQSRRNSRPLFSVNISILFDNEYSFIIYLFTII